jgi:C4-dicarboxylate transporter DctM subunit
MIIVLILLFVLMFIGVPIAISLAISALVGLMMSAVDVPLVVIPQRFFTAVDTFSLITVPFFILAGELMMVGSMGKRITDFAVACVGWLRGGLAQASTLASMLFAGISGSGAADTAAVGKMMIPIMEKKGYDKGFAASTIATAGTIAVVIPPSIPMIIYGVSAGVSISTLFMAGIIPGIVIGLSIMALNYWTVRKKGYGDNYRQPFEVKPLWQAFKSGFWALLLPVIIIGGIRSGVFTPTESAAIAAAYALIVSAFIYRDLKWKHIPEILNRVAITTGMVLFIIAAATFFGWVITAEQVPLKMANFISDMTNNEYVILFLINVILLIAGCFLNTTSAITILTPLLMPLILSMGIDPIFFGLIMVVNLSIGLITPPVGLDLFVVQGIANVKMARLIRSITPFIILLILDLMLLTYVPQISMWLPSILK